MKLKLNGNLPLERSAPQAKRSSNEMLLCQCAPQAKRSSITLRLEPYASDIYIDFPGPWAVEITKEDLLPGSEDKTPFFYQHGN
jgi:hypothetical protein